MNLAYRSFLLLYLLASVQLLSAQAADTERWQQQLQRIEQLRDSASYPEAERQMAILRSEILRRGSAPWQAQVWHLSGWLALDQGRYEEALQVFLPAQRSLRRELGDRHPATAQAYNDMGQYYFATGQLDSAWQQHQLALAIRINVFGTLHPETADSYNNLGNILQLSGAHEQALDHYQRVVNIRRRHFGQDHPETASALNNMGSALLSLRRLDEAQAAFRKSWRIRRNTLGEDHPLVGRTLLNVGNVFYEDEQLDSARHYYTSSLNNARKHYAADHPALADLYENLGNCALRSSQLEQAEQWYRRALNIRDVQPGIDTVKRALSLIHLGDVYLEKGDYPRALLFFRQGEGPLAEVLSPYDPLLTEAQEKVGLSLQYLGQAKEAQAYFESIVTTRFDLYGMDHPLVAGSYTNLGNVFWLQDIHDKAIECYQRALEIWQRLPNGNTAQQIDLYSNIGNNYFEQGAWREAIGSYHQALRMLPPNPGPTRASLWRQIGLAWNQLGRHTAAFRAFEQAGRLLSSNDIVAADDERLYLAEARASSLLHCYQQRHNEDTLVWALALYDTCLNQLATRQQRSSEAAVRQKVTEQHYRIFSGAIESHLTAWEVKHDSSHLWQAFALSEQSKNLQLRERWLEERSASDAASPTRSHMAVALNCDERTAQALRNLLADNSGLLAFFTGTETIYWFYLDDVRLSAGRLRNLSDVKQHVGQLEISINNYPLSGSQQRPILDSVYRHHALALYRQLWQPIAKAITLPEKITIITDGPLSFLPFTVLLTEEPRRAMRYRSYPYLLHRHTFSYAYSAALLAHILASPPQQATQTCLAVAPTFVGHQPPLSELAYNRMEVESISRMIGTTALIGEEADLSTFLQHASQYRILHLATHGVAGVDLRDSAYLAFTITGSEDAGRLNVRDLYQLRLPAELVVMSACGSGGGLYLRGEGTISLERGFIMAGARSVVSTLWPVADAKTADFMIRFYEQLQKGKEKDVALKAVQERYIRESTHEEAHPFYWAAYLPSGDMSPLDLGRNFSWQLFALLAIVIGLGVVIRSRVNSREIPSGQPGRAASRRLTNSA